MTSRARHFLKPRILLVGFALLIVPLAGCLSPARMPMGPPGSGAGGGVDAAGFSDREPKRLEARVLMDMGDFEFVDDTGAEVTFRVPAGQVVGIHVRNVDEIEHEIIIGRTVAEKDGVPDGYEESLFDLIEVDVFAFRPAKMEIGGVRGFGEIELESGADAWIRTTFPESAKGTWEIGCFVPDHYQRGMKATLVVE